MPLQKVKFAPLDHHLICILHDAILLIPVLYALTYHLQGKPRLNYDAANGGGGGAAHSPNLVDWWTGQACGVSQYHYDRKRTLMQLLS